MSKKKFNSSKLLLILTIVFFILAICFFAVNVYDFIQKNSVESEGINSIDLSEGGIVSINIVENPENTVG